MTERAAIVPTGAGPVGAIVSEPEGEVRRGLVLLQGGGPPCRAGINSVWARLARAFADRGVAVLRFDFTAEGESGQVGKDVPREPGWRQDTNLAVLRELGPWFGERMGLGELSLAGSCHGARVAIEYAAVDPAVEESFLIVPYLWTVPPHMLEHKRAMRNRSLPQASELFDRGSSDLAARENGDEEIEAALDRSPLDEGVVETCRQAARNARTHILIGEGDSQKPLALKQRLEAEGERLDVDVAPGMIIHPVTYPEVADAVTGWLANRVLGAAAPR